MLLLKLFTPTRLQVNKKNSKEVKEFMRACIETNSVQVAYLQGTVIFQKSEMFPLLLELIKQRNIWSINLGELKFSIDQMTQLKNALKESIVSFMFYECDSLPHLKDELRGIIRNNRSYNTKWKLSSDETQNEIIKQVEKNW